MAGAPVDGPAGTPKPAPAEAPGRGSSPGELRRWGAPAWAVVYLAEAHALDEWPIHQLGPKDRPQHTGLECRLRAAREMAKDWGLPAGLLPVYADPQVRDGFTQRGLGLGLGGGGGGGGGGGVSGVDEPGFNAAYASWPSRFWVLGGDPGTPPEVLFKATPHGDCYHLEDLEAWLDQNCAPGPPKD